MQSYIYVDIDDEITTVIGKLKAEKESRDVFLVVPKRALIAQSLVNLQLLDKEAKKIAKKLIFVSPDSHTRKIAEKAGLEVKKYVAKPEEPKLQTEAAGLAMPKKLSPAEEAAAKEELNVVMGKVATDSHPEPVRQNNQGVNIRPSAFASGSSFARNRINVPPKPNLSLLPAPDLTHLPPVSLPQPVGGSLPKINPTVTIGEIPRNREERLPAAVEPSPSDNNKTVNQPKSPIVDLRKENPQNNPQKEVTPTQNESNPFKVRSIIKENPAKTEDLPISKPTLSPDWGEKTESAEKKEKNVFIQHEKELANLTLREKERLRDLWMENKGVVRGKFIQRQGNIDLRKDKAANEQTPKSFEENDGLIKTTRRIVSGSGKVVDLRAKKINIENGSVQPDLKKKDQKEILLPLVNVRFFSIFIVGIMAVLMIVAGIVLPKADISAVSKNIASDFEMSFKVNGETAELDLKEKNLPGKPVRFKLTQENIYSATGEKDAKEKSRGQVTFYNKGANAVEIKKNSLLIGEKGKKYYTLSPVTVPAGSAVSTVDSNQNSNSSVAGLNVGEIAVEATAADFGSDYDLKSGTEVKLEEGAEISVKVTRAFSGGKNEKVKIVTEDDINKAKEDLTNKVKSKSSEEAKKYFDSGNNEILFPSEAGLEEITFSSSKDKDEVGENFSAKMEVSFFALTFSASDAKRIAEETVESDDKKRNGSVSIGDFRVTNFNPLENQMEVSANFQYKEKPEINSSEISRQLVAKSRKEGENFLSKNSEIESYVIKIFPGWLPWFPLIEKNIEIKID